MDSEKQLRTMQKQTEILPRLFAALTRGGAQKQTRINSARTSILLRAFAFRSALVAVIVSAASPTLPGTPAGQTLKKWLEAFNSGDHARMIAFAKFYMPDRVQKMD